MSSSQQNDNVIHNKTDKKGELTPAAVLREMQEMMLQLKGEVQDVRIEVASIRSDNGQRHRQPFVLSSASAEAFWSVMLERIKSQSQPHMPGSRGSDLGVRDHRMSYDEIARDDARQREQQFQAYREQQETQGMHAFLPQHQQQQFGPRISTLRQRMLSIPPFEGKVTYTGLGSGFELWVCNS
ncbi:uncharacterized protein PHALS_12525 [Plasmopara halstedii]|uniref:Uncharacterized protein n=1 Tax=Plasmopara halstedii TaxID=4781 RepID=A0A0P1ALE9_PLAHL|nr:uncharacterized protein PHALS_12525 [Plasmopara halstedii]CEG42232.1 hypothetical protein PHALS_12525 [Plasmopara halstedii]|eukprot:XP_024578601.1 hypothetical protein PHALS_12525 [Plasmopara halstedii]